MNEDALPVVAWADHLESGDVACLTNERRIASVWNEAGYDVHELTYRAAAIAQIRELEQHLAKANAQHEHFEREWYLRGDDLEAAEARIAELQQQLSDAAETIRDLNEVCATAMSAVDVNRRRADAVEQQLCAAQERLAAVLNALEFRGNLAGISTPILAEICAQLARFAAAHACDLEARQATPSGSEPPETK